MEDFNIALIGSGTISVRDYLEQLLGLTDGRSISQEAIADGNSIYHTAGCRDLGLEAAGGSPHQALRRLEQKIRRELGLGEEEEEEEEARKPAFSYPSIPDPPAIEAQIREAVGEQALTWAQLHEKLGIQNGVLREVVKQSVYLYAIHDPNAKNKRQLVGSEESTVPVSACCSKCRRRFDFLFELGQLQDHGERFDLLVCHHCNGTKFWRCECPSKAHLPLRERVDNLLTDRTFRTFEQIANETGCVREDSLGLVLVDGKQAGRYACIKNNGGGLYWTFRPEPVSNELQCFNCFSTNLTSVGDGRYHCSACGDPWAGRK